MDCSPPGFSVHADSLGKNTGVDCHALFQGNFPTRGSNPGLPHCRRIHYCLSQEGSPAITRTCIFYLQPTPFHPFLGGPGLAEAQPPSQPHSQLLHWVWEAWPFPFFLFCFLSSSRIFLSAPWEGKTNADNARHVTRVCETAVHTQVTGVRNKTWGGEAGSRGSILQQGLPPLSLPDVTDLLAEGGIPLLPKSPLFWYPAYLNNTNFEFLQKSQTQFPIPVKLVK